MNRILLISLTLLAPLLCAAEPKPFELLDGDRVAFVGNTFFERDLGHNYLETLLTAHYSDRNVLYRNLGWSGDTVTCQARAMFGSAEDGFKHLTRYVTEFKPTVIVVAYGMSESFEGEKGLPEFQKGLDRVLDMLGQNGTRIVLLSPVGHEKLPPPLPDATEHNKNLQLYGEALKKTAATRGYNYVSLLNVFDTTGGPYTDNGIHMNARGYKKVADAIVVSLGVAKAVPVYKDSPAQEKLRAAIHEKNQHFFHRWRPQNDTYIFGFRKKEQGRNAVEIPQFDPLIAAKEAEIAKLRATAK